MTLFSAAVLTAGSAAFATQPPNAPAPPPPACLQPGGACDRGSAVAGGTQNAIGGNGRAFSSFIGAGDLNLISSATAYASDSFIGAGASNTVSAESAAIVAGSRNAVDGGFSAIGAGYANVAKGADSFVGAGTSNAAGGAESFVGGGSENSASGEFASVAGGRGNVAAGKGSAALGTGSVAAHDGTFVWSDGAAGAAPLKSTAPNQWLARASGGLKLFTNAALSSGVTLAPGSGAWASASDRALKTGVAALDDAAILAKVDALPVDEWSYRSEPAGIRHVGPMAQDFYAAFRVGEDDRHITSIDEDGVALAAIKALDAKARRVEAENARLERALLALSAEVKRLSKASPARR